MGAKLIYTEQWTERKCKEMFKKATNDKKVLFIGEVLDDLPCSREVWNDLLVKYKANKTITETYKRLKRLTETRIVKGALNNELSNQMSVFVLKNNHSWKDKQEIKQEITGNVSLSDLFDKSKKD